MTKKIYRSPSHKMIGGVCFGLAAYLDIDATLVRLIFVALAIITAVFPMFIFYVIAWIIIPLEEDRVVTPSPAPKPKTATTKTKSSSASTAKKKS